MHICFWAAFFPILPMMHQSPPQRWTLPTLSLASASAVWFALNSETWSRSGRCAVWGRRGGKNNKRAEVLSVELLSFPRAERKWWRRCSVSLGSCVCRLTSIKLNKGFMTVSFCQRIGLCAAFGPSVILTVTGCRDVWLIGPEIYHLSLERFSETNVLQSFISPF